MRLLRKHSCPTRGVHRCLAPRSMPAVLMPPPWPLAPAHAADQTPKLSPHDGAPRRPGARHLPSTRGPEPGESIARLPEIPRRSVSPIKAFSPASLA